MLVSKGWLSSTQMPATMTQLDPVMLSIDRSLNNPPEPPHRLTALVRTSEKVARSTMGVEPLPTERPMPCLQSDWDTNSRPARSTVRSVMRGEAFENKSTPTREGLTTVTFSSTGSDPYTVIPYTESSTIRC